MTNDEPKFGLTPKNGEGGHRSHYLSHAKRALYHLSYIPVSLFSRVIDHCRTSQTNVQNFDTAVFLSTPKDID